MAEYRVGSAVVLAAFGDAPVQRAVVVGEPEQEGDPYMVEIDPQDRDAHDRDGLCEVAEDQFVRWS